MKYALFIAMLLTESQKRVAGNEMKILNFVEANVSFPVSIIGEIDKFRF